MNCYQIKCETTNSQQDTILVTNPPDSEYIDCEQGVVFVFAESAAKACAQLGEAQIKACVRMGLAHIERKSK